MDPELQPSERAEQQACGVHARARRVRPGGHAAAARAWPPAGPPAEAQRLLPAAAPGTARRDKARLQDGLTLGVRLAPPTEHKVLLVPNLEKPPPKTKYQKRKERLVAALRPPYFILSMIVVITGLHAVGSEELRAQLQWSPDTWRREPWRLVTYSWVHASAGHVALNALVGLAVGWRLEREQGWWRAAAVWAGGVAAGALGAGLLQPTLRVVGASAAVYALLTAHLPNVCLRFGHIPLWWFRPLSVVVLAASEASWSLMRGGGADSDRHDRVAWAAHVFGAAIGVPLAFLVFTGENAGRRGVLWCRALSLALLAAGCASATLYFAHCARAGTRLTHPA